MKQGAVVYYCYSVLKIGGKGNGFVYTSFQIRWSYHSKIKITANKEKVSCRLSEKQMASYSTSLQMPVLFFETKLLSAQ